MQVRFGVNTPPAGWKVYPCVDQKGNDLPFYYIPEDYEPSSRAVVTKREVPEGKDGFYKVIKTETVS